jgi:antitoxin (DNA-binding transcriptional repressor) of toxin-antitoxin stability system
MVMKMVNIADAKAQLSELLDEVVAGGQVVICKRNHPVAELRAMVPARTVPRPLGLAAGAVTVPAAFFEQLPGELLDAFQPQPTTVTAPPGRVAERRAEYAGGRKHRARGGGRR